MEIPSLKDGAKLRLKIAIRPRFALADGFSLKKLRRCQVNAVIGSLRTAAAPAGSILQEAYAKIEYS